MYPLLSRFLVNNLEVLGFCLEQNIADNLEKILEKLAEKKIKSQKANQEILAIINSKFDRNTINQSQNLSKNLGKAEKNEIESLKKAEKTVEKVEKIVGKNKLNSKSTELNQELEKNEANTPKGVNFSLDLEEQNDSQNGAKNLATASLRAPVGYHLPNAMKLAEEKFGQIFEKFGGHPCAAGFSVTVDNLELAKEKLSRVISEQLAPKDSQKSYIDPVFAKQNPIPEVLSKLAGKKNLIWLPVRELTPEIIKEVWLLEPFGQDFEMPQFMLCLTIINSKLQGKKYFNEFALKKQKKLGVVYNWLGKEQKHLKIDVGDVKITVFNIPLELKKKLLEQDDSKIKIWLRTRINQNTWQDKTTIELLNEELWLE